MAYKTWKEQEEERVIKERKAFSSFTQWCHFNKILDDEGDYRCHTCKGNKRIIHPDFVPDVIEGHKFADYLDCVTCKVNGKSTGKEFKSYYETQYKNERSKYQKDQRKAKSDASIRKRALSKLTKEERDVLGVE